MLQTKFYPTTEIMLKPTGEIRLHTVVKLHAYFVNHFSLVEPVKLY